LAHDHYKKYHHLTYSETLNYISLGDKHVTKYMQVLFAE